MIFSIKVIAFSKLLPQYYAIPASKIYHDFLSKNFVKVL
nr:MAG TPA: hypothetical protein [Caudoviricetes sp.]